MQIIKARNAHQALPEALYQLEDAGHRRESRNGEVLRFPWPVATHYFYPTERVVFWPERDANPFFHLFEALWMLAGRDDVLWPAQFAGNIRSYSDDGEVLWGAYGRRWRHTNVGDQIPYVVKQLREERYPRRAVLSMWLPSDLQKARRGGKDIPCNTHVYFSISMSEALDMTVCCRSNDLLWGAYGANVVHFSVLQEYVAAQVCRKIGAYYQMSNDLHVYTETEVYQRSRPLRQLAQQSPRVPPLCPYYRGQVEPYPLLEGGTVEQFDRCLVEFLEVGADAIGPAAHPFFWHVARPMLLAWEAHQLRDYPTAFKHMEKCWATDWRLACEEWLARRSARYHRAQDDGVDYDA